MVPLCSHCSSCPDFFSSFWFLSLVFLSSELHTVSVSAASTWTMAPALDYKVINIASMPSKPTAFCFGSVCKNTSVSAASSVFSPCQPDLQWDPGTGLSLRYGYPSPEADGGIIPMGIVWLISIFTAQAQTPVNAALHSQRTPCSWGGSGHH